MAARATMTLVAVVAVLATGTAPAEAQAADNDVRITISEFTGVLGPGSRPPTEPGSNEMGQVPLDLDLRVLVENEGERALADLTLVVEVHPPVTDQADLRQALDGDLPAAATAVRTAPVLDGGRLSPGAIAGIRETIDRDELRLPEGGGAVRPIRIAVVRGLEVLDEVVTPVVWLDELPEHPLVATLVWPYDAPPLRTVGGAYMGGVDREFRPGGRLDVLLRSLERGSAPRVTFAPAPHLLEDLADRADGFTAFEREDDALESRTVGAAASEARHADNTLQRIRELAANLPLSPLAGTYAGADLTALHDAGGAAAELAADAAADGRRRLQRQLGRDIDATSHLLQGPTDLAVLDLIPGENVLVRYDATTEPPLADDPDVPGPVREVRTPSGRLVTVVVADPYLEETLADLDHAAGPIAAAQRVVGQTAIAYLDAPAVRDRALLLLPPATWDPTPRAASRLLDVLVEATWLGFAPPDELIRGGASGSVDFAEPPLGPFEAGFRGSLDDASVSLAAAASSLPPDENRLSGRSISDLNDALLRASSRWLRGTNEAESLVRDVQRAADETFGDVEVATGPITLTSDTGQIPITLQRTRGEAIQVSVEVASQGRLRWPEGRRSEEPLLLEPGSSQTISFPTHALTTGTFPVTVRVTDPSGSHELGRASMTVRSTAISGPALSLIGLAILILLLLGALRRPDSKPRLEVVE